MKKIILTSVILFSTLRVWGAGDGEYLPVVAYRDGRNVKVEYAYDAYGHVVSMKKYLLNAGAYVPTEEETYAYHLLPNGEFVRTWHEFVGNADMDGDGRYETLFGNRTTYAYDSRGVQLLEQYENYREGVWTMEYRAEAILDGNGVRTGVRSEGEGWENAVYSFDGKGRTVRVTDGEIEVSFTWNDRDELTAFKLPAGLSEDELTYLEAENIRSVYNGRYFNPYRFLPWTLEDWEYSLASDYARDDYTLHIWLFDADLTMNGVPMAIRSTVDEAAGEMQIAILESETVMQKIVINAGENGGWTKTTTDPDGETYVTAREYDPHGAVTGKSEIDSDGYERIQTWVREYDAAGRPVKTTYSEDRHPGMNYVETYEEW
ncbi:MAG: hypothetical protein LBJ47_03990, partial [Tannerella sp.]|nr:hypothetical protein [Tannerella sp.]